jgi:hypothetical protein
VIGTVDHIVVLIVPECTNIGLHLANISNMNVERNLNFSVPSVHSEQHKREAYANI